MYGARNIVFDRILMHPGEHPTAATQYLTRGKFAFNIGGSYLTVKNSYVYDFFGRDPVDAQITSAHPQQTVVFLVSPTADHLTVENNFLESWYAIIHDCGIGRPRDQLSLGPGESRCPRSPPSACPMSWA